MARLERLDQLSMAHGRRMFTASREQHARLLQAFVRAVTAGDIPALVDLLAPDAVITTDGGPDGRTLGGLRNLPRPLAGAARVAAFVVGRARRAGAELERRDLNGQPALVFSRDGHPFGALLLAVADDKIQHIFFHADPARLRFLGGPE